MRYRGVYYEKVFPDAQLVRFHLWFGKRRHVRFAELVSIN